MTSFGQSMDDIASRSMDMEDFLADIWAPEDAESITNIFQPNNYSEENRNPKMTLEENENPEITLEDFLINIGVLRGGPIFANHGLAGERFINKKRPADETDDMATEQQLRMKVLNRESAARSRARKQAYTLNLEVECNHLTEENAHLRREQQRVQEMWRRLLQEQAEEKEHISAQRKNQTLRRWKSCEW